MHIDPTPRNIRERTQLEADVAAFLDNGGQIQKLPYLCKTQAPLPTGVSPSKKQRRERIKPRVPGNP